MAFNKTNITTTKMGMRRLESGVPGGGQRTANGAALHCEGPREGGHRIHPAGERGKRGPAEARPGRHAGEKNQVQPRLALRYRAAGL